MRLLLIEDDRSLVEHLKPELERSGFAVDVSHEGVEGEYMGNESVYDLVILDLGLPQRSGMDVLKHWREQDNHIPVLVLTARDAWHERVDGFQAGADDYLGKPFHTAELIARIRALLHRSHHQPAGLLNADGLSLDEDTQTVKLDTGTEYSLTNTEFRLLRYFLLHQDKLLSKSELIDHVYEMDAEKDSNVIEVYIRRLRDKLGKSRIQTRRGQGYLFLSRTT